jgi:hypothetical protein
MHLLFNPSAIHVRNNKTKSVFNCPKCNIPLQWRLHRPSIVKSLLPFLPLKRYECLKCLNKYYVYSKRQYGKPRITVEGNMIYANPTR